MDSGDYLKSIDLSIIVEKHQDELDKELIEILEEVQLSTIAAAQTAKADEEKGIKLIVFTLVGSLVLSILLPIIIGKTITSPINQLNQRMDAVAKGDGDLTIRLDDSARDETGDAPAH